jgi:hypothetical protein
MTSQGLTVFPRCLPEAASARRVAPAIDDRSWAGPLLRQRLLHLSSFSQSPPPPNSATVAKQRLRIVILLDRANRRAQELLATIPR